MTPEAQRIAIAEACGWKHVKGDTSKAWVAEHHDHWLAPKAIIRNGQLPASMFYGPPDRALPDYLNDLNAMHEAENVLTQEQRDKCYGQAWKLARERAKTNPTPNIEAGWEVYHATAAQRAEAFLRCLNLWQEDRK